MRRVRRGTTLVEVLAATVLLALAASAGMRLLSSACVVEASDGAARSVEATQDDATFAVVPSTCGTIGGVWVIGREAGAIVVRWRPAEGAFE
jgi:hypothetical protein